MAPKQSLPAAVGNSLVRGAIVGTGRGIEGLSRTHLAADKGYANAMLRAVEALASDESAAYQALTPMQRGVLTAYRRATPERQAEMQAEWQSALTQGTPWMTETGAAIAEYGEGVYVDPRQEGDLTGAANMLGAFVPALPAAAIGAVAAGPVGGIAGMSAVMWGQAYSSTRERALEKGATEDQAAEIATKNAATQVALNVLPLSRVLKYMPDRLRGKFVQTVAEIGRSGLEFAGAGALGTLAENFIIREEIDPNQSLTEGVWANTKSSGIVGALIPGAAMAGRGAGRVAREQLGQAMSPEVRRSLNQIELLADEAQPTIAPEAPPVDGLPPDVPGGEPSTPAQGSMPLPFNPDMPTMRITPEPEAVEPPRPPGTTRMYHGGQPYDGEGGRWLSPSRQYAEGYADQTPGAVVHYIDIPNDSPLLVPSFDATGTDTIAPPVHFEATPEMAAQMRQLPSPEALPDGVPEGPVQDVLPADLGRPADDVAPAPDAVFPEPVEAAPLPPMGDPKRPPKPPSLFDFLISKGGIKPDGDLIALGLDTVHHQRAGRLLNKNGMTVDRAREVAAHYLRTGRDDGGRYGERTEGDVADFYNALAEEHAGRPVYPPEYATEVGQWKDGQAADRERIRGEELAAEARAAAEESGVRLNSDEEMHAARLIAEGARPEEAVYEAVRASDIERGQAYDEARGMLSAREKGQADQRAQGAPSPEAGRARQQLAVVMQRLMRLAGLPSSVGLKLVDRIVYPDGTAADGVYLNSLITYALDTRPADAPTKLFHEVTHALMDPQLGVLTPTQRNALMRAADRWLDQGKNRQMLTDLGYAPENIRAEAVAQVAEGVVTKARREAPITTRAVDAMNRAVEAIGSGLRGQGFWSADGVFRAVMQGRVKGEGKGGADGESLSRRPPKPPPSGPDLFGGERREPEQRAAVPTFRTDPRQEAMPGMEPSAVQAQASRDATGRGGLEPRVPQARPDEGLFGRPQPQTAPLITPRPATSRLIGGLKNFVDMIGQVPDTGRPHVDSRAFVLDKGQSGLEYITIISGDRNQVVHAGTTNQPGFVAIETAPLDLAPDGTLTVHHNHPSRSSLSIQDVAMSAVPALANVVAHAGPEMHIGRPGERLLQTLQDRRRGRESFTGGDAYAAARAALEPPYAAAVEIVRAPLQAMIDAGKIDYREANRIFSDIAMRLLHQAGWVDYTTTAIVPVKVSPEWRAIQGEAQKDGSLAGNRRANTVRIDEGLAGLSRPLGGDAASAGGPPIAGGPENAARGTGPAGRQDRLLEGEGQFGREAPEEGALLSRRPAGQNNLNLARSAWEIKDPSMVDRFLRAYVNKTVDMDAVQASIEKVYGPIPDSRNASLKETNYHGRVSSRVLSLHDKHINPILQKIADNREGVTIDDVDRYLLARHAPERNKAMKEINPDRVDNDRLSGMSDKEAEEAIKAFAAESKLNRLEDIAKDVDKLTADTRKVIKAEGLEAADTIKAWEDAYQFYAPLQRDIEGNGAPKGSGFNVRGPESKRSMGSTLEVKNILANIVAQAETAAIRAEKNKVTTALADLAKQYPADGFWKVDEVPTTRQINKDTGLVEVIPDPLYQLADNVVMYKEGGKHHFIKFDEKNKRAMEVARGIKNMDPAQRGLFSQMIGWPARFMSQLLTRYNPEFWETNFIRDIGGAQFNLFGTDMKGGRKEMNRNIFRAMKGLHNLHRGDGKSQWAQYAKEMDAAGGTTGYMEMYETSDKRMNNLKSEVAKLQQGKADPRRLARATLEMVDDYNSIVENSVRLAAFQAARKQGLSTEKAARVAKNITVNFNRKGNLSPLLNDWFMFFNASVQGTKSMVKAAVKSPKARAALGAMAATGFLLDMVNREVIEDYDAIPDFEKQHNFMFQLGSGPPVKLPYPPGLNSVFNVGRLLSEWSSGRSHKEPIEYAASMAMAMLDAFNPMGSVGSVGQFVAPSAYRWLVQLLENKAFTGAPVFKSEDRGPRGDAPEPAHRRHFQNTPEMWIAASRGMNALTGGDYAEKGAVNVSPDALRHIFTSLTGGPGRMVDRTVDYLTSDEPSVARLPFVGRLVRPIDERDRERSFMRESRIINTAINKVDFLLRSGRPDAADDIIKDLGKGDLNEGFRILGVYRAAKEELDRLRRQKGKMAMQEPDEETTAIGRMMRDMTRQSMGRALREGRP